MTKEDAAWLIVRTMGVGFIIYSIRYLFIIMQNFMLATTSDMGKLLISQSSGLLAGWLIEGAFYLVVGLLLLFKGRFLFCLINRNEEKQNL